MQPQPPPPPQVLRGIGLALGAAIAFGMTAPLLARATIGVGALGAGCCLYLGAAGGAALLALGRRCPAGMFVNRADWGRMVVVALLGGALAPALLVFGLKQVNPATASLLLVLEAPFTVVLAHVLLRERLGPRVVVATGLMMAGGLLVAWPSRAGGHALGAILVGTATLAWACDNLLSRKLAEGDPLRVVVLKGAIGAFASGVVAMFLGEAVPPPARIAGLVAIGAIGFGLSLQLYLRAQSLVGAARTASVFAAGPFIGTIVAFLLGAPWPGWQLSVAAILMATGIAIHASEHHDHRATPLAAPG